MKFEGREFIEQEIRLDYNTFINCKFINCNLMFSGGDPPLMLGDTSFVECSFIFQDAALRTLILLSSFAHGSDEGRRLVLHHLLRLPEPNRPVEPTGGSGSAP